MRRAHRRLLPSLVSAAVLALGLSACGSGDGGSGSDGTVTLT
ncbi:branched-chain amino acid ABC transporter substrate-binding protein, partial [Micromonospora aurantiaca]|nr:branched-chain amino acid ABC transporter substrate-binding protein [Micromonospora aurantiaca]